MINFGDAQPRQLSAPHKNRVVCQQLSQLGEFRIVVELVKSEAPTRLVWIQRFGVRLCVLVKASLQLLEHFRGNNIP
jgi:hypothetical protein